ATEPQRDVVAHRHTDGDLHRHGDAVATCTVDDAAGASADLAIQLEARCARIEVWEGVGGHGGPGAAPSWPPCSRAKSMPPRTTRETQGAAGIVRRSFMPAVAMLPLRARGTTPGRPTARWRHGRAFRLGGRYCCFNLISPGGWGRGARRRNGWTRAKRA